MCIASNSNSLVKIQRSLLRLICSDPVSLNSMSHRYIDSCTFKLNSWKPFHIPAKALDSSDSLNPKRPCLSDRATSFAIDSLEMSNLTLFEDDRPMRRRGSLRLLAGKRRRRGSRSSLSGRSSDRSANRRYCPAAYATCSDIPVAAGTDSSGELFVNGGGEANWASDVSEARSWSRNKRDEGEHLTNGIVQLEGQGNESGYGSEPGYRGDAELGYGDEEEDDQRPFFWGSKFEGQDTKMEVVGENSFSEQKSHHRCRRKKHDCRMMDTTR